MSDRGASGGRKAQSPSSSRDAHQDKPPRTIRQKLVHVLGLTHTSNVLTAVTIIVGVFAASVSWWAYKAQIAGAGSSPDTLGDLFGTSGAPAGVKLEAGVSYLAAPTYIARNTIRLSLENKGRTTSIRQRVRVGAFNPSQPVKWILDTTGHSPIEFQAGASFTVTNQLADLRRYLIFCFKDDTTGQSSTVGHQFFHIGDGLLADLRKAEVEYRASGWIGVGGYGKLDILDDAEGLAVTNGVNPCSQ